MQNYSSVMNIVIQLPDDRVLVYKDCENTNSKHTITIEKEIIGYDLLSELQTEMWNRFGINTLKYSDSFVDIKRHSPINLLPEVFITLFLVRFKSSIAFEAKTTDKFSAILWEDLVRDIMRNSMYTADIDNPKHSKISVHVMKELHTRGVFGKCR
jgi:hypothetical protein